MATFEGYERREAKILATLKNTVSPLLTSAKKSAIKQVLTLIL